MIKRIRITNFKSLGDVTVHLDPVTVLIGRSGTGKSNFVEALRGFRDLLRPDTGFLKKLDQWHTIIPATASGPVTISFDVMFDAPGLAKDYEYTLALELHILGQNRFSSALREERLVVDGRVLFHQKEGKWLQPLAIANSPPDPQASQPLPLPPFGQPAAIANASQPSVPLLSSLTGIREIRVAHLVLSNGIGCYTFPDSVLTESPRRPSSLPQPAMTQPATSGAIAHDNGFLDHGENYMEALAAISTNLQNWQYPEELVAALQGLNPFIKSVELQMPQGNQILVTHQVNGQSVTLDLGQESEGFRRLLAHLIALYQTPPKQTLIFDEPEKGLHTRGLAILADQFKAFADKRQGQVLLTTHSPEFLNHFGPEQIRVVEMRDYLTQIGPVAPEQYEALREQFLQPGELLTVDEARLAGSLAGAE